MNLGRVYDIVLTVLKKEARGNIVKPARFTYLLQQCHLEYYNQQYEKYAGSQLLIDSLRPFLAFDETITFASGEEAIADLTNTYKHAITARVTSSSALVDIVTPVERDERISDSITAPSATYPIMTVDPTKLYILPTTVTGVTLSYLVELKNVKYDSGTADTNTPDKLVDTSQNFLTTAEVGMTAYNTTDGTTVNITAVDSDTTLSLASDAFPDGDENYFIIQDDDATDYFLPFFDYYIDAKRNVNYLTNGQTYTLLTSEVYRDGTSSGKVVGVSHELKWKDQDVVNIITLLLKKLSISIQAPEISQLMMQEQQQQNTM